MRSLELLDVFLLTKYHANHPQADELLPYPLHYKSRDSEIVISPLFFYALKSLIKEITWVDINVKHDQFKNELNFFRYDVILYINKEVKEEIPATIGFNSLSTQEELIEHLKANPNKPIQIETIPYDYMSQLIDQMNTRNNEGLKQHLKMLSEQEQTERFNFAAYLLNINLDQYETFVHYHSYRPQRYLKMLVVPKGGTENLIRPVDKQHLDNIHLYCREPFSPWLQKFCFEHIKLNVKKHVMAWVNPSVYIWVEKWPQTSNGKLDKKKLSLPLKIEQHMGSILSQLQKIWLNITGDNALIAEEFWVHGVSSLSMYYFLATINETFHLNLSYHEFHHYNTMEKVADYIEIQLGSQAAETGIKQEQ